MGGMPHLASTLSASLFLAATLAAQGDFIIWPERNGSAATYTDRLVGTLAGEIFQEIPGTMFAGVGDRGGSCNVTTVYHWATDENPTTQETFHLVFRRPDPVNPGPDPNAAGLIARVGPFNLPTGGSQRQAWLITTTLSSPVPVPCKGGWFLGLDLPASPQWSMDGHSVWVAWYNPPSTRNLGENARNNAPNHSWRIMSSVVTPSPSPCTLRLGCFTPAPALNIGGIDPANVRQLPVGSSNYGAGGMYPDISGTPRSDGIDVRIHDPMNIGGRAHLVLGSGITPITGLSYPGIAGRLWLDPTSGVLVYVGSSALAGPEVAVPVALPGTIPPALMGQRAAFQGLTVNAAGGNAAWSNLQVVSF